MAVNAQIIIHNVPLEIDDCRLCLQICDWTENKVFVHNVESFGHTTARRVTFATAEQAKIAMLKIKHYHCEKASCSASYATQCGRNGTEVGHTVSFGGRRHNADANGVCFPTVRIQNFSQSTAFRKDVPGARQGLLVERNQHSLSISGIRSLIESPTGGGEHYGSFNFKKLQPMEGQQFSVTSKKGFSPNGHFQNHCIQNNCEQTFSSPRIGGQSYGAQPFMQHQKVQEHQLKGHPNMNSLRSPIRSNEACAPFAPNILQQSNVVPGFLASRSPYEVNVRQFSGLPRFKQSNTDSQFQGLPPPASVPIIRPSYANKSSPTQLPNCSNSMKSSFSNPRFDNGSTPDGRRLGSQPEKVPNQQAMVKHTSSNGFPINTKELCATCKEPALDHCVCEKVFYCSRQCQEKDWLRHKRFCPSQDFSSVETSFEPRKALDLPTNGYNNSSSGFGSRGNFHRPSSSSFNSGCGTAQFTPTSSMRGHRLACRFQGVQESVDTTDKRDVIDSDGCSNQHGSIAKTGVQNEPSAANADLFETDGQKSNSGLTVERLDGQTKECEKTQWFNALFHKPRFFKDLEVVRFTPFTQTPVVISHFESPSSFYVQLVENENSIIRVRDTIYELYRNLLPVGFQIYRAKVGEIVVAQYMGVLYRGRIIESADTNYCVQFIDYGDSAELPLSSIWPISTFDQQRVLEEPVQAVLCSLHGAVSGSGEWNCENCEELHNEFVACGGSGIATCVEIKDNVAVINLSLSLDVKGSTTDVDILQMLIERGFAVALNNVDSLDSSEGKEEEATGSEKDTNFEDSKLGREVIYAVEIPNYPIFAGVTYSVMILRPSPSTTLVSQGLFVSIIDKQMDERLQSSIENVVKYHEEICATEKENNYQPVMGQVVLGFLDGKWQRAKVNSVDKAAQQCFLTLIDSGGIYKDVPTTSVRPATIDVAMIPRLGIPVGLHGLEGALLPDDKDLTGIEHDVSYAMTVVELSQTKIAQVILRNSGENDDEAVNNILGMLLNMVCDGDVIHSDGSVNSMVKPLVQQKYGIEDIKQLELEIPSVEFSTAYIADSDEDGFLHLVLIESTEFASLKARTQVMASAFKADPFAHIPATGEVVLYQLEEDAQSEEPAAARGLCTAMVYRAGDVSPSFFKLYNIDLGVTQEVFASEIRRLPADMLLWPSCVVKCKTADNKFAADNIGCVVSFRICGTDDSTWIAELRSLSGI